MDRVQRAFRLIFFSAWSVMMAGTIYVLGAPSLKVLRAQLGRGRYWTLVTVISAGLYASGLGRNIAPDIALFAKILAVLFFSLGLLVGIFDEFEEMEFSLPASAFFTLLINSLIASGAFALWVFVKGATWPQVLMTAFEDQFKWFAENMPQLQPDYAEVMHHLPARVVIVWLATIYLMVLLESRLAPEGKANSLRPQLATVRLPDAVVWILIASIFGAFVKSAPPNVSLVAENVFFVCSALFVCQGLGVVSKFFDLTRIGPNWRVFFTITIVLPLVQLVAVLGLLDYWFDFRARMNKRVAHKDKEKDKEVNREA
jgi:uncharacterized protein YybS (DUF2232 family)